MLRRSLRIWLMIARSLLFLNFGMAIAARVPMITTTMRSSMRVKPLVDFTGCLGIGVPLLSLTGEGLVLRNGAVTIGHRPFASQATLSLPTSRGAFLYDCSVRR